jgi:hypothetical protein
MKNSLTLILEQPKPKPGATKVRNDLFGSTDNTSSDSSLNINVSHKISEKCKTFAKYESEIPEPYVSQLRSAVEDAESEQASSYVADHLCHYSDDGNDYLALAGRLKNGDDYYFKIKEVNGDWFWEDVEDNNQLKPFEQY